ncbi:mesencephalic astrocyte-derived neurotrophic factor homolog [Xenia sp. Carnegie-2017]|uniref:mesencephalic astrocyte-derived neurotrophic factor homolog n=1 Tax=Xenia sp. Carnegie-2017 TaxID=2897299 RepID=UPI001F034282|nr:mesencephalic astrocyte-derived neurotrophic factor homolog [Xenia sp. Carnegie-2017]
MYIISCTLAVFILGVLSATEAKLREGDCDVCIKFLTKFSKEELDGSEKGPDDVRKKLKAVCKKSKGKDQRFCYYIGGTDDAATSILNEITKPMSYHVPPEKICEKLKDKDAQICELQYEQKIDVRNVDLKKMRVKQLRKILQSWEEECNGCIEKSDFIQRIEELKDKHIEL